MIEKLKRIKSATVLRLGAEPNFFENHLNRIYVPGEVRTMLWFPLTPKQAETLSRSIFEARVDVDPNDYLLQKGSTPFSYVELVKRYFEIQRSGSAVKGSTRQERQWQANIASALDALVGQAYSDVLQRPAQDGGIDRHHQEWWRLATLRTLQNEELTLEPGYPRSLLTHTQAILDGAPDGASLRKFEQHLQLVPHSGGHDYEAELELFSVGSVEDMKKIANHFREKLKLAKNASEKLVKKIARWLPFGGLFGTLQVRKQGSGAFKADYTLWLAGLNISRSFGTSVTYIRSKGEAKNVYGQIWRPEDIPGPAHLTDVSGSLYGGKGASGGLTFLYCTGGSATAPRASLGFNFSSLADVFAPGVGGGIGGLMYTGKITAVKSVGGDVEIDLPGEGVVVNYEATQATVHFPVNGAGLTDDGCELLEIFAACELAVLNRPSVSVTVDGFADQPDEALNNMILSRNRAITVYNYLKNILEDDMATPELRLDKMLKENKERVWAAKAAEDYRDKHGKKPKKPIVIDVSSGERAMIVAHGEPEEADANKREKYDAEERRVEVHVGSAQLVLRRGRDK